MTPEETAELEYLRGLERGVDGNGWTLRLTPREEGRGWRAELRVAGAVLSVSEAHTRGHALLLALCSSMSRPR